MIERIDWGDDNWIGMDVLKLYDGGAVVTWEKGARGSEV